MESIDFMRIALSEAALALRENCWPYPGVGVVLVHDGRPVVRAHNGPPGSDHSEIRAFKEALQKDLPLDQMTLYATLEPCCNRTGLVHACTAAIILHKLPEVHIAHFDPYEMVRGRGIAELKAAGIKVVVGELEEQARWLNRKYWERFCPSCGYPMIEF